MKKLSLVVLFAVLMGSVAFAQQKPAMSFERTEHNFGTIKEEMGAVMTWFEFTNTGKSPLIIQRVSASCGCTTPTYYPRTGFTGQKGKHICKILHGTSSGYLSQDHYGIYQCARYRVCAGH